MTYDSWGSFVKVSQNVHWVFKLSVDVSKKKKKNMCFRSKLPGITRDSLYKHLYNYLYITEHWLPAIEKKQPTSMGDSSYNECVIERGDHQRFWEVVFLMCLIIYYLAVGIWTTKNLIWPEP